MKIYKYYEFILEGNTPEDFITTCLEQIKSRLLPAFASEENSDKVKKMDNFKNFNLQLQTPESEMISRYNPTRYMLKIKFLDDTETMYAFTVTINVEDAIKPKKDGQSEDFHISDIKKAHVEFDKYVEKEGTGVSLDPNSLPAQTVDPNAIDADFLIKLKVQLDKGEQNSGEEEFSIETGDKKDMPEEEKTQPTQAQSNPQPQGQGQAQKQTQTQQ